jgi:acyl-coenzyme A synthetase/AMP-(fatty) acid ligase
VSPLDVEAVVLAVDGVRECGVVGAAGDGGLTEVVACVVAADAEDAVRARIAAACERLPRHQRPKRVVLLDALPRTPTGKLQRFALRDAVLVLPR